MDKMALPESYTMPEPWRALPGQQTPCGERALFRSSPLALMRLRLAYRRDVLGETAESITRREGCYQRAWDQYVERGRVMQRIVALAEQGATAVECDHGRLKA